MPSKLVLCFCVAAFTCSMFQIAAAREHHGAFRETMKMPISCYKKSTDICFDRGQYPTNFVENLMRDIKVIDHIPATRERYGEVEPNSCDHKISDCPADCMDDKQVYYIRDENDHVRVVVQSKNLTQIVTTRRCMNEGLIVNPTKNLVNIEPFRPYNLTCATRYLRDYMFIVVSRNGRSLEMVKSKNGLPVCCSCRSEVKN